MFLDICRWRSLKHTVKDQVLARNGTVVVHMVVVHVDHLVEWTMFGGLITVSFPLIFLRIILIIFIYWFASCFVSLLESVVFFFFNPQVLFLHVALAVEVNGVRLFAHPP